MSTDGNGEQHLVLNHLAQAVGSLRHRNIRQFTQGIPLQVAKRDERIGCHLARTAVDLGAGIGDG